MNKNGFSLLEVMVAAAVLTAGVAVVAGAMSRCAQVTGMTNDTMLAVFLAEDKLQELELKEKAGRLDTEPNESVGDEGKFNVACGLARDADWNLYSMHIKVSWERLQAVREFDLITYLR